jgi:hypothetical protein
MSNGNNFDYGREFVGNLHAHSKPVPVRVETRLRVTTDLPAREIDEYRDRAFDRPPYYVFAKGGNLEHPTLYASAVARHYFTW